MKKMVLLVGLVLVSGCAYTKEDFTSDYVEQGCRLADCKDIGEDNLGLFEFICLLDPNKLADEVSCKKFNSSDAESCIDALKETSCDDVKNDTDSDKLNKCQTACTD